MGVGMLQQFSFTCLEFSYFARLDQGYADRISIKFNRLDRQKLLLKEDNSRKGI